MSRQLLLFDPTIDPEIPRPKPYERLATFLSRIGLFDMVDNKPTVRRMEICNYFDYGEPYTAPGYSICKVTIDGGRKTRVRVNTNKKDALKVVKAIEYYVYLKRLGRLG